MVGLQQALASMRDSMAVEMKRSPPVAALEDPAAEESGEAA
jgi:hypothetical protein